MRVGGFIPAVFSLCSGELSRITTNGGETLGRFLQNIFHPNHNLQQLFFQRICVMMAEAEAVVEASGGESQNPLVQVSFQKNPARKQKYLESEPKALGVTQISLSVFQISSICVFAAEGLGNTVVDVTLAVSSMLVIIAGAVAVAAQNLHLPTLQACLGMQVAACVASVVNMLFSMVKMEATQYQYWRYHDDNGTALYPEVFQKIDSIFYHFHTQSVIIQVALLAVSAALAAYCCKAVNCCSPASKTPVIIVQTPPVQA